ncbi:MAG: hypothetical protein ACJAZO_005437 [Myxococcota bacterium]
MISEVEGAIARIAPCEAEVCEVSEGHELGAASWLDPATTNPPVDLYGLIATVGGRSVTRVPAGTAVELHADGIDD